MKRLWNFVGDEDDPFGPGTDLIISLDRLDYPDPLLECQRDCSFLYLFIDALEKVTTSFWELCEYLDFLQDFSQKNK